MTSAQLSELQRLLQLLFEVSVWLSPSLYVHSRRAGQLMLLRRQRM